MSDSLKLSPFERTLALPAASTVVLPLAVLSALPAFLILSASGLRPARHR